MSIIEIKNITKTFTLNSGFFTGVDKYVKALDYVSLNIETGKILGIVGESGSGKTTLAKAVARLILPDLGTISFDGKNISEYSRKEYSNKVQMIFQDPFASLNPKLMVSTILSEACDSADIAQRKAEIENVLDSVGLDSSVLENYPHQFSGGQRQRIALARALLKKPEFVVADEPLSALDVSIGTQLLKLFIEIKHAMQTSFVFITHDIAAAASISDSIVVMQNGKIVEEGPVTRVINSPEKQYTKNLIAAVPVM